MSALTLFILLSRITGDDKMAATLAQWNLTTYISRLAKFILDNWTIEAALASDLFRHTCLSTPYSKTLGTGVVDFFR
jgi:hypothetical protein